MRNIVSIVSIIIAFSSAAQVGESSGEHLTGMCGEEFESVFLPAPIESDECDRNYVELFNSVPYLSQHPNIEERGFMDFYINCKGEVLKVEVSMFSVEDFAFELDEQLASRLEKYIECIPGYSGESESDYQIELDFTIKNGTFIFLDLN